MFQPQTHTYRKRRSFDVVDGRWCRIIIIIFVIEWTSHTNRPTSHRDHMWSLTRVHTNTRMCVLMRLQRRRWSPHTQLFTIHKSEESHMWSLFSHYILLLCWQYTLPAEYMRVCLCVCVSNMRDCRLSIVAVCARTTCQSYTQLIHTIATQQCGTNCARIGRVVFERSLPDRTVTKLYRLYRVARIELFRIEFSGI